MKKTAYYYLSLAAIVVGGMTSCQDEDMGVDYETVKLSVYERDFLKQFGEPAPNHKWGFDNAKATFDILSGNFETSATRAVIKQDQWLSQECYIQDIFGKPANITDREHSEVYAWFTNHRVNWKTTPTWYQGESTRETTDGKAHIIDSSNPNYGSLKDYPENPLTGDYIINNNVSAFNGWIQHVNSAVNMNDADEKDGYGTSLVGGEDFLRFWTLGSTEEHWEHLNDFNTGNGYGYGNQSGQNAIFVSNANFNVVTYGSSQASSLPHDKYYIVYLKGADYEGWYLGLDYEADRENANPNERVAANGICNDWIIKISDVGTPKYNPARIMCEDLGGSFDTDFNDIVYDVELVYNGGGKINKINVTLRAAGGTLPIKVTFKDQVVWEEVHAAFGVPVTTPVNVGAEGGATRDPLRKDLLNGVGNININDFDMDDINVYVKRSEKAEWVNITRLDKESLIPCRICVPNTVRWSRELQSITLSYPGFIDWVKDPSKYFWTGTINQEYLY